jgi:hypothetical protein
MVQIKTTQQRLTIFKSSEPITFKKVAKAIRQEKNVKKYDITSFHITWKETETY